MPLVAAIQMVSTDDVEENLSVAIRLITEATEAGAELVCLPENFAFMGHNEVDKFAMSEYPGDGPIQSAMAKCAQQLGVHIIAGTIPLRHESLPKVYASSLVFDANGLEIARYDKIHLFDVSVSETEAYEESAAVVPGASPVVVSTELGMFGLSVCYDIRFPELYQNLQRQGAQVLFIPAAFTAITGAAHWEVLCRARAIENLCYVVAPNQGGTHINRRQTYGHSMIVDHWGRVLASAQLGEAVITAEVDFNAMNKQRDIFPSIRHGRLPL